MNRYISQMLGVLLAFLLSGVLEPAGLFAQQPAPQAQEQQQNPDQPAAPSPDQPQAPNQTQTDQSVQPAPAAPSSPEEQSNPDDQQAQSPERQKQQDKASQQMINTAPERGTQLPESPDMVRARQQAAQRPSQRNAPQPSGTAAAQEARPAGAIASRPAGAAIAPAKQKQVRSWLIKLGVIAGAGAALGTVYGLSRASGPKPPGAR